MLRHLRTKQRVVAGTGNKGDRVPANTTRRDLLGAVTTNWMRRDKNYFYTGGALGYARHGHEAKQDQQVVDDRAYRLVPHPLCSCPRPYGMRVYRKRRSTANQWRRASVTEPCTNEFWTVILLAFLYPPQPDRIVRFGS